MRRINKRLAVFDIDGTIFRSSLVIELTQTLVRYGIFPPIAEKEIEVSFKRWRNRKGKYETYIDAVVDVYNRRIKRVESRDVVEVSRLVLKEQKDAVYVYTRELIKDLKSRGYVIAAISGSPDEAVKIFSKLWKFDFAFGTKFEIKNGFYTGVMTDQPSRNKKQVLLELVREHDFNLKQAIGVGDTESDISFLEVVGEPICFNPNQKLYEAARRRKWKVVVERKDVIYEIQK